MADNLAVTPGTGASIAMDEAVDATLGTVKFQYVKIADGTIDGTTKAAVGSLGLKVDPSGVAHDAVATSVNPVLAGGYASAAAPTDVSADGDSVRAWHLRNGAQAVVVTAAGALIGATSNALDVNIKSGVPAVGITTESGGSPVAFPSDMRVLRTSQDSSTLLSGNTSLTPKFKAIAVSTLGNNGFSVSAVSKKIRVLAANVTAAGAVNFKWRSATAGDISGLTYCDAAGTGVVLPYNPLGWFETTAGEDLQINLSGAVAVGGHFTYVEV